MSAADFDHDEQRELTASQRTRLAELDAELERDEPELARLARRDPGDLDRWHRTRASWWVGSDRKTRWVVGISSVTMTAVNVQMFMLALRGGNLPGLAVTLVVFLATAWLLTRPAASPPTPDPTSPPLDHTVL